MKITIDDAGRVASLETLGGVTFVQPNPDRRPRFEPGGKKMGRAKRAIHAPHPNGDGGAWCGARASFGRIAKTGVTCERCNRLRTKRTWIPR